VRHRKLDIEKLSKALHRELSKLFDNIQIVDVVVSLDSDRDGNDLLRVKIVFTGDIAGKDAKTVAGASRQLRPTIDRLTDDDLYPLLSFVSKVDYERGHKCEAR
jgi:hypothetical protein